MRQKKCINESRELSIIQQAHSQDEKEAKEKREGPREENTMKEAKCFTGHPNPEKTNKNNRNPSTMIFTKKKKRERRRRQRVRERKKKK